MEGAAEGDKLAAAVLEGYGTEVIGLEERLAEIQHEVAIRENVVGDVGLLKAEGLLVGLQAEEDAHGHSAVFRGQVGQFTIFVAAGAVEAVSGLDEGGVLEVPHLPGAGDLPHLNVVIVVLRIAHTQLTVVVAAAPKHAAVLHVEIVVVTDHLAAAPDRDGALHAALVIVVQGLPLLSGKAPDVTVILGDGADTVGDQHRRAAEGLSCAVQVAALGQEQGVIISANHIHDLLGDVHLYRLTAIGGGAVTQLAILVVFPRPDGAVLLQGIVAAITAICVIIRRDLPDTGHGLAVVKAIEYLCIAYTVVLQRTIGEDISTVFLIASHCKIVHAREAQLLGYHIVLTPAPEGAVAEPGVVRTRMAEILYILHLGGRSRIGDADH